MNLLSETKFSVRSDQSDMFGRLRLSSLFNFFIQAAIDSSNKFGFGFETLKAKSLTWMLGRISVEIYKQVLWNDNVRVETWPKTVDGLLYIRDFIAYNDNNEIIARGTTGWLAVDFVKKRITKVDFIDENYRLEDKKALDYMPIKIDETNVDEIFSIKSLYYDIDLNQHVTAIRYIDWMMDTFHEDFHSKNFPTEVHINYLKEIKSGQIIELGKSQISNNKFFFSAKNLTMSNNAFRAIIKF